MFDLGERFGAATFGWAFLEGNTIAGVIDELEAQVKLPKTVGESAEQLRDYFLKRLRAHLDAGFDDERAAMYSRSCTRRRIIGGRS